MKRSGILVAMIIATLPAIAGAQTTAKSAAKVETKAMTKAARKADTPASLKAEAKITEAAARSIALKQIVGGSVKSSEIEREKGHLVYSFDITVAGKSGIDEVLVDAMDGSIVSTEHETPKMEKAEAKKEAKEKTSAKKKK